MVTADNTVSVLMGKGDGTFQPFVAFATGSFPNSLATGDFNGDGKVDLATANSDNTVSILLGAGNGTFQAHIDYPAGATSGRFPTGVIAADFNGDGRLDLAVGTDCNTGCTVGSVSILLGTGDGTFPTHVEYVSSGQSGAGLVATGDFNGDGQLDLVLPNTSCCSFVSILLGRGSGTFQHRLSYAAGKHSKAVATADFSGDGKLDLAVANSVSNTVSILLGNGNGTFQSHVDYASGSAPGSVIAGDFNGDGKLDLAVANSGSNDVSILLGNGVGTFQTHADYATGTAPSSVIAGDFNGDGKPDLAVANSGSNTVSILLGKGDGTFQTHVDYSTGTAPSWVAIGDFNDDGRLDLAVANYRSNSVSILLGKGDGTFHPRVDYNVPTGPVSLVVGDFDRNGTLDMAVACSLKGLVKILWGNGDGTFFPDRNIYATGSRPAWLTAGDFNGDGKVDLAAANSGEDTVSIILGTGNHLNAFFLLPFSFDLRVGSGPSALVAGDFNGDGGLDLAVAMGNGGVSVLLNDPALALSPTQLTFGNRRVGTTSGPMTVLLSNPSTASFEIGGITIVGSNPGDFTQTNTCNAKVLPGANCTISVTITPRATGIRHAGILINDNALAGKQIVRLTGVGTTP